jgi:hypothetical protein
LKIAAAFAVSVVLMLVVVVIGDQLVGLSPETPSMTSEERREHLPVVFAAIVTVLAVNLPVVWLTLRRPVEDHLDRGRIPAGVCN